VIMGSLIAAFLPRFQRSLEQARADVAGANLRAIWAAERLYWLDNQAYTSDLGQLVSGKLLDPTLDPANQSTKAPYTYTVTLSSTGFTAQATRASGSSWTGVVSITDDGTMSGTIQRPGDATLAPGFQ
jgi:type II secretory pathway pseudopilin PulG